MYKRKVIHGVPLVSLPIVRLQRARRAIQSDETLLSKIDGVPDYQDFTDIAKVYKKYLPAAVSLKTIRQSLEHRVSTILSVDKLAEDAWLLTGNVDSLVAGQIVRPWSVQILPEWLGVQIVDMALHRTLRGKAGAIFSLRVLTGSSAGHLFELFKTLKFCGWLAQVLGFTNQTGKRPFQRVSEFMNLQLYVLAVPGQDKQPVFEKFYVSPAMHQRNRKLLAVRNRDVVDCPKGYHHHCYACPLGYDQCGFAVHPTTYVHASCHICKLDNVLVDPRKLSLEICVQCDNRRRLSKKG